MSPSFCHKIQYIITIKFNESIYDWATLGFIGPRWKKTSFRMKLIFILMGTLISKIDVYGAQKTYTWSYRSQCVHYKRLFGAACGAKAVLASIYWKMRTSYSLRQWRPTILFSTECAISFTSQALLAHISYNKNGHRQLAHHDNRFFYTRSSWYWSEQCLISTGCYNLPHIAGLNRFIALNVWLPFNYTKWWWQLASKKLKFGTVGQFPVGRN